MLFGANELTLGEAFIYDDFDVEGNLEAAFELRRLPGGARTGTYRESSAWPAFCCGFRTMVTTVTIWRLIWLAARTPSSVTARPSPITTISPTISTPCGSIVAWCIRAPISSRAQKTSQRTDKQAGLHLPQAQTAAGGAAAGCRLWLGRADSIRGQELRRQGARNHP